MENKNQILEWIVIGISQQPNSMNEYFYFDKSNMEFFSILTVAYFMLDENFNIAEDTTTSYSESSEQKIVSKIKRIENEDPKIIPIPRLSYKKRTNALARYLDSIDNLAEKSRLEKLYLNTEESTIFDRRFEIESEEEIVEGWNKYRNDFLLSKAESFLNLNNINPDSAQIWEPGTEVNITIDLTKDEEEKDIESE